MEWISFGPAFSEAARDTPGEAKRGARLPRQELHFPEGDPMHLVGARGPEKAEARSPQSQNGVAAEMTRSRVRATRRDRGIDIQEWNANYGRAIKSPVSRHRRDAWSRW